MNDIKNLTPKSLWQNFAAICQIPHPSGKEQKLITHLKTFAEKLNLEYIIDQTGNIIIKKPATISKKNCKKVILQCHVDMVAQKNAATKHDFTKDPIAAYINDQWVKARGTTLGADNGIGVAATMAILENKDIEHPAIEALFTIDEEIGMKGAKGLGPHTLTGEILLNLDTEKEGHLYVGCAGGINTTAKLTYQPIAIPKNNEAFILRVNGLKGGHSGVDIHLGLGNAVKILARILWCLNNKYKIAIANIEAGGELYNVIAREALATICINKVDVNKIQTAINNIFSNLKNEFSLVEPNLTVTFIKTSLPKSIIDKVTQTKLLNTLYSCIHGVISMSQTMPGLVETSNNLAACTAKNGNIKILTSQRSAIKSAKHNATNIVRANFNLLGAKVAHTNDYPSWQPNPNSEILQFMQKVYKNTFSKKAKVLAIHAGLECGILGNKYPHLDMISFGPTICNAHSPDEKVNIKSVELFWNYLIAVLQNIL